MKTEENNSLRLSILSTMGFRVQQPWLKMVDIPARKCVDILAAVSVDSRPW